MKTWCLELWQPSYYEAKSWKAKGPKLRGQTERSWAIEGITDWFFPVWNHLPIDFTNYTCCLSLSWGFYASQLTLLNRVNISEHLHMGFALPGMFSHFVWPENVDSSFKTQLQCHQRPSSDPLEWVVSEVFLAPMFGKFMSCVSHSSWKRGISFLHMWCETGSGISCLDWLLVTGGMMKGLVVQSGVRLSSWDPILPYASCATLGKALNFSMLQFPLHEMGIIMAILS